MQPTVVAPTATGTSAEEPVDGRAARWQGHRATRRAELANEARKAVHRLGAEASMEELAGALGTSKSILYRYFADKTGLQHAVGEVVVARMLEALVEAAHTSVTPRENLRAVIGAYLEMVEGSPSVYGFVTQVPSSPQAGSSGSPLGSFLEAVAVRVVAPIAASVLHDADEAEPGTRDAAAEDHVSALTWAAGVVGFVRGAGDSWLATPPERRTQDRRELTEQVTEWLWAGVSGRMGPVVDVQRSSDTVEVDIEVGHGHHRERA